MRGGSRAERGGSEGVGRESGGEGQHGSKFHLPQVRLERGADRWKEMVGH